MPEAPGKPFAPIYEEALRQAADVLGRPVARREVLAIGDGMLTDVKGAADFGLDVLYVSGGIHWREYGDASHVPDPDRLLAFFGRRDPLPHPALETVRTALGAHYGAELGEPFTTAGLCLYRDGRDGVAWHGDTGGRGSTEDTMVAILSLGAPRHLALRPRRPGPVPVRRPLGHGDLIVMGGSCQRTWEHAVPKTARAVGPRISVQFRPDGVR